MVAKPASSSFRTSTPRISAPICGPSRRTSIMLVPAGARTGAGQPLPIARGRTAREAAAHEARGVVVALESEVALHHGLLVDLPLGVAAPDAVHFGLDRLAEPQPAPVIARPARGRPPHPRQPHACLEPMSRRAP